MPFLNYTNKWICSWLRWGAGAETAELAKRPLSFIRGFRLCLRGAGKPLKHSEQRISDGTCISERSCSISCENLNHEGSIGNWQGGCLEVELMRPTNLVTHEGWRGHGCSEVPAQRLVGRRRRSWLQSRSQTKFHPSPRTVFSNTYQDLKQSDL